MPRRQLVQIARQLIAVPSPNPPGDTRALAEVVASILREIIPGTALELYVVSDKIVNLAARVCGTRPGKRVIFSGHLDTYPVNEGDGWSVSPFGGIVRDGRLYGRGAADMKGGIAASISALTALARHRDRWCGEAVLTLAGDEESMGVFGAKWLIDHVPYTRGDAVIIGDAGSPQVLHFGEKGLIWVELEAVGKAAHGAHVHLGLNAIDRLRAALDSVISLREASVRTPEVVKRAITSAMPIAEPLNGTGETEMLSHVTVNVGWIEGGTSINLVPAKARARVDVRLPVGVSTAEIEATLASLLSPIKGVSWRVLRRFEPSYTDPNGDIVRFAVAAAHEVLGQSPAVNIRVGASDARLYRQAGMPTIVYGPTPFNIGGADEYVLIDELDAVARVHALASYDFLS